MPNGTEKPAPSIKFMEAVFLLSTYPKWSAKIGGSGTMKMSDLALPHIRRICLWAVWGVNPHTSGYEYATKMGLVTEQQCKPNIVVHLHF